MVLSCVGFYKLFLAMLESPTGNLLNSLKFSNQWSNAGTRLNEWMNEWMSYNKPSLLAIKLPLNVSNVISLLEFPVKEQMLLLVYTFIQDCHWQEITSSIHWLENTVVKLGWQLCQGNNLKKYIWKFENKTKQCRVNSDYGCHS